MTERPVGRDSSAFLANVRAERVKRVAALAGRSARSRAGLFLVEGPQGVREAVRFASSRVRDLYITPDAAARYRSIVTSAEEAGVYVHFGSDEVLAAMSGDAQGVLAVVSTEGVSLDSALAGAPRLVAVLADVRDPGNAGTVIRAADAAGADCVVLAGESVDLTNPKVVRSTAGSLFHLPVVRGGTLAEVVSSVGAAGLTVLATDGTGDVELNPADPACGALLAEPTAWVFGNEAHGLSPEEAALADHTVRIPIHGAAESLNLATAAAVCLYASAWAQR
ncbi:TrmH family RNA methyltransferase [Demequina sp.]|uniref:TrmH family RNA methyltransferase n=1 Tax=Demequina sp. TaxID=2050685 RepID=UPI003D103494